MIFSLKHLAQKMYCLFIMHPNTVLYNNYFEKNQRVTMFSKLLGIAISYVRLTLEGTVPL